MKNNYYNRLYATREGVTSDRAITLAQKDLMREKVIKKQRLILATVFILIIIFSSLTFLSGRVYADSSIDNRIKMYKSVLIFSGDSLESLAETYMTDEYINEAQYIKEVIAINNLGTDINLIPGNHIILPYYDNNEYSEFLNASDNKEIILSQNPVITISKAE